jgi:hypothetical protein
MHKRTLEERFWIKVKKAGPDDCWFWQTSCDSSGYGQISDGVRRNKIAHRVSWELEYGPIPEGLSMLHKCDVPTCCNPNHLFLGTTQDNMTDKVSKGREAKGSQHGKSKLIAEDIRKIRARYAGGKTTYRELGELFGVSISAIAKVTDRRTWKHVV